MNILNSSVIDAKHNEAKNTQESHENNQKNIINMIYKNDEVKQSQSNF